MVRATFRKRVRSKPLSFVVSGLAALLLVPAAGYAVVQQVVSEPGTYHGEGEAPSSLTLISEIGDERFTMPLYMAAACSDGVDNDWDGTFDRQADSGNPDPDCENLHGDDNERLAGFQENVVPSVALEIAEDGVVEIDPATYVFTPKEVCPIVVAGEPWCYELTLRGVGPVQYGTIDPGARTASFPFSFEAHLSAVEGTPSIGEACIIGPLEGTLTVKRVIVDEIWVFNAMDVAVPEAGGCTEGWNEVLNEYLGLPGSANLEINYYIKDSNGAHIIP